MVASSTQMEQPLTGAKERGHFGSRRRGAGKPKASDQSGPVDQQHTADIPPKSASKGPAVKQIENGIQPLISDAAQRSQQDCLAVVRSTSNVEKSHENPNRWGQALGAINKSTSASSSTSSSPAVSSMPAPKQQQTGKQHQQKISSDSGKADQVQNASKASQQQQPSKAGAQEKDKAATSTTAAVSNGSSAAGTSRGAGKPRGGSSPRNRTSDSSSAHPPGYHAPGATIHAASQQQGRDSSPAGMQRMSYSAITQQSRGMTKLGVPRSAGTAAVQVPPKTAAPQEPFPPLPVEAMRSKDTSSSSSETPSAAGAATAAAATAAEGISKGADKGSSTSKPNRPAPASTSSNSNTAAAAPSSANAPDIVSARWVPRQKPAEATATAAGRTDSPSSRGKPRSSSGGSAGGSVGKAAGAPSNLKPSTATDSSSAGASQGEAVAAAAATSASSPLPPNPSMALAAKAAAASGIQASLPPLQQHQHKAVQLPSSQAVNMAAVSAHNSNKNVGGSYGDYSAADGGYGAADTYASPDGFGDSFGPEDSFGAGFAPAYEGEPSSSYSQPTSVQSAPAAAPATVRAAHVPAVAPALASIAPSTASAPPDAPAAAPGTSNSAQVTGATPQAATRQEEQQHQQQQQGPKPAGVEQKHVSHVPAAAAASNKNTLAARHGLSVTAPPFMPTLVPFQAGGGLSHSGMASGPASTSSSRSGSIYSNQLEQQMFAGAVGTTATMAAAAAAATAMLSSSSKAAATGTRISSSSGAGGSSSGRSASSLLTEALDIIKQEEQAHSACKQQLEQEKSRMREQHQQVEKERALRIAAEDKSASLSKELDAERWRVKDLESRLSSEAARFNRLEAEMSNIVADRDRARDDVHSALGEAQYLREQLTLSMQEKSDLESQLAKWKDSYNQTESENKHMRDLLGPRAPAPHSLSTTAAPAPASAAPAEAKQPPPGFGPVPISVSTQRQQPLAAPAAAPPAPAAQPQAPTPQPPTPTFNAEQHMKNEHELVRILLSLLPEDPNRPLAWGDGEEVAVDAALLPLSWQVHYLPIFGSILTFMRQRPAVFGEVNGAPYPMFFKVPGAEQKVNEAEEAERAQSAAAAATAAPWHVQGQQQQHQGFADSSSFLPEQQGLVVPAAPGVEQQGGWGAHGIHASMPMMPHAAGLGVPGLSVPFMAQQHQGLMGVGSVPMVVGHAMAPPMSMPMAPPSMPGVAQQHQHHQAAHPHHGGW